jgi:hypothetical protein
MRLGDYRYETALAEAVATLENERSPLFKIEIFQADMALKL